MRDALSPMKVLVVDDEKAVVEQLTDGLSTFGFTVLGAHSAADARALLAADTAIGVVVTDIRMPGEQGLDLAQAIIADRPEDAAIEVIVITGHATIEDAATAVRHHVFDFLRKPFRLNDVVTATASAMQRAIRRRREAASRAEQGERLRSLEAERAALRARLDEALGEDERAALPPAAARALERDMAAISHALRTPLIAISGGAERLVAGEGADQALLLREGVQRAVAAVELVEELHRVDRPDPDEFIARLPLKGELERACRQLAPLVGAKALDLSLEPPPALVVEGPALRLRRAVELTVAAAVDWAPPGGALRLTLAPLAQEGRNWAVLTAVAGPAGALPEPPAGLAFEAAGSALARTQECLRFAIARRLAEQRAGRMTSWNGEGGCMALRLALPL